jgi:hypothetical protein
MLRIEYIPALGIGTLTLSITGFSLLLTKLFSSCSDSQISATRMLLSESKLAAWSIVPVGCLRSQSTSFLRTSYICLVTSVPVKIARIAILPFCVF